MISKNKDFSIPLRFTRNDNQTIRSLEMTKVIDSRLKQFINNVNL